MINAKALLPMIFIVGLLIFSACATPRIMPFPEGHPADPGLREATVERSMTLADPDPVDTRPARSEHFDHNGHDPNGHDPKDHDPKDHDPNDHDPNDHDPKNHDSNDHDPKDHDPKDHDMHEDAQPEHQEQEHRHHEMHH
jgi:hypothetical protein